VTGEDAKRIVVVSTGATALLSVAAAYKRGDSPSPRIAVGAITVGTMLAVAAEFAPRLAAAFAALMLTSAVFVLGGDAWQGLTSANKLDRPTT
jgi:uncharacterized membrane protein YphA (DoxX/SURF4 family)